MLGTIILSVAARCTNRVPLSLEALWKLCLPIVSVYSSSCPIFGITVCMLSLLRIVVEQDVGEEGKLKLWLRRTKIKVNLDTIYVLWSRRTL